MQHQWSGRGIPGAGFVVTAFLFAACGGGQQHASPGSVLCEPCTDSYQCAAGLRCIDWQCVVDRGTSCPDLNPPDVLDTGAVARDPGVDPGNAGPPDVPERDLAAFEPTWTDPTSGLMWENPPSPYALLWQPAIDYCQALGLAGFTDWRLPTISELRTLIRGCPIEETGGGCAVTDQCASWPGCWSQDCQACNPGQVPANGGFWPEEMAGDPGMYWSSTNRSDDTTQAWAVAFNGSYILAPTKEWGLWERRCLRTVGP